ICPHVVAAGHHADDLADVGQVVDGPRGEELAQGHGAEIRMRSAERQVDGGEIPGADGLKVLPPQFGESVEQRLHRPIAVFRELREAIERIEGPRLPMLADDARPRNPICLLIVHEVADDDDRAPRVRPLVYRVPVRADPAQQSIEHTRRALQEVKGVGKVECHDRRTSATAVAIEYDYLRSSGPAASMSP